MIIGLSGSAGSGKDTVGGMLRLKYGDLVTLISFAEPMKTFCMEVFEFTHNQCWGNLEAKKAPDPRYPRGVSDELWEQASLRVRGELGAQFCKRAAEACPGVVIYDIFSSLISWFSHLHLGTWAEDDLVPLTPREALQTLGTEWGRDGVHKDLWINLGLSKVKEWLSKPKMLPQWEPAAFLDTSHGYKVISSGGIAVVTDCRFVNEMHAVKEVGGCVVRLSRHTTNELGGVAEHASEQEQLTPEALELIDHHIDNTDTLEYLAEHVSSLVDNIL